MRQKIHVDSINKHFRSLHVVSRAVHQDIYATQILQHLLSQFSYLVSVRHIACVCMRRSPPCLRSSDASRFLTASMLKKIVLRYRQDQYSRRRITPNMSDPFEGRDDCKAMVHGRNNQILPRAIKCEIISFRLQKQHVRVVCLHC